MAFRPLTGLNNKISRLPKRLFVVLTAFSTSAFCLSFIMNGTASPPPDKVFLQSYRQCFGRMIADNKVLPFEERHSPLEIKIACMGEGEYE